MAGEPKQNNVIEAEAGSTAAGGKKWIFLVAGFAVLVTAGLVVYLPGFSQAEAAAGEQPRQTKPEVNQVLTLEPLLVNLSDSAGAHFARISLALGVFNAAPEQPLDSQIIVPKLKDYLLTLFGSHSSQELSQPECKAQLKDEILKATNQMIPPEKGQVLEVYFTEFIIQ